MGIARSAFYDEPSASHDDTAIVEAIAAICDDFEAYGCSMRTSARSRSSGAATLVASTTT
jgi:putative transposase